MNNVLITGGTGYFGQGFVRRLLNDDLAERICIFSRDEYKQSVMRRRFNNNHRLRWFIGDVRDVNRLETAMDGIDTVIHTAALKHVSTGEYNPTEMVLTNVQGSMNVITAACKRNVKTVIGLSTDKACEPINVYGSSKLMMERLFLAANNTHGKNHPVFKVVRYGNVAGSTGSVIPVWRDMKNWATQVEITHPDCTRFWMSLDEAVQLVLSACLDSFDALTLRVPSLPAYRLADLAEAMELKTKRIGLPLGEKMHESMLPGISSENARRMSIPELQEALQYV